MKKIIGTFSFLLILTFLLPISAFADNRVDLLSPDSPVKLKVTSSEIAYSIKNIPDNYYINRLMVQFVGQQPGTKYYTITIYDSNNNEIKRYEANSVNFISQDISMKGVGGIYVWLKSITPSQGYVNITSAKLEAMAPDNVPPSKPTGLKINADVNSAVVTWDRNKETDMKGYDVFFEGVKVAGQLTSPSYQLKGLKPNTEYSSLYVVAVDITGNVSEKSDEIVFRTLDDNPPSQVKDIKVLPGVVSAVVTWSKNPEVNVKGYEVYLDDKKIGFTEKNSYELSGLSPKSAHKVYIKAINTFDKASDFNPIEFETDNAVTQNDQQVYKDYILVTWDKTQGAAGYNIYLNGRQVGSVGPDTFEFKITKDMGYRPDALSNVTAVKAKFADGSTGESNNTNPNVPGRGWGFGASDIWTNIILLVGSLGLFLLLGICIKLAPKVFGMLRKAVQGQRGY